MNRFRYLLSGQAFSTLGDILYIFGVGDHLVSPVRCGSRSRPFPVMLWIGVADSAKQLAAQTLLQLAAPVRQMPSVFAAQTTLVSVLFGLSLLFTGWLADHYGIRVVYLGGAACYGLSFAGSLLKRQVLRQIDNKEV